jgi:sortase A
MPGKLEVTIVRTGEVLSYLAGVLFLGFFVVQIAQGEMQRRDGVAEFSSIAPTDLVPIPDVSAPDTSLWAPGRLVDYQSSLAVELPPVLGVLAIPSVGLEVPIYPSDSDLLMDRGSGVIDGMSYPHEPGNIGIAGHRDGYFRALKDVQPGDSLLLETLEGPKKFVINATQIVEIDELALLHDTREQTVTLVTCYPFYFVGHAPQRFIVTASLDITDVNQQKRRN